MIEHSKLNNFTHMDVKISIDALKFKNTWDWKLANFCIKNSQPQLMFSDSYESKKCKLTKLPSSSHSQTGVREAIFRDYTVIFVFKFVS